MTITVSTTGQIAYIGENSVAPAGGGVGTATASTATTTITVGSSAVVDIACDANSTYTISSEGAVDGQRVLLRLTQDDTGSRTVAFDSSVIFGTDITTFTASTAADTTDIVGLMYSVSSAGWLFATYARGFAVD